MPEIVRTEPLHARWRGTLCNASSRTQPSKHSPMSSCGVYFGLLDCCLEWNSADINTRIDSRQRKQLLAHLDLFLVKLRKQQRHTQQLHHIWCLEEGGRHERLSHRVFFLITLLQASCQQQLKSLLHPTNKRTENLLSRPVVLPEEGVMLISASIEAA